MRAASDNRRPLQKERVAAIESLTCCTRAVGHGGAAETGDKWMLRRPPRDDSDLAELPPGTLLPAPHPHRLACLFSRPRS